MQKSGETVEFVYNENGLRVQKTATSTGVTKYTLHGKNIVHMTQGNNELHFFYDAQNKPAVVVYNGTPYSYVKDLQGDIVAILDSSKNVVVSYVYDAWGRPISKTGSMANTLGKLNPFCYRGYVYDEETGLYYLRSRYYNPKHCRFINADCQLNDGILNSNQQTYCVNNPVMLADSSGRDWDSEDYNILSPGCDFVNIGGCYQVNIPSYAVWSSVFSTPLYNGMWNGGVVGPSAGDIYALCQGGNVLPANADSTHTADKSKSTAIVSYYPPNNGFASTPEKTTLSYGTMLQRTGNLGGRFVAPAGTPGYQLSLPYDQIGQPTTYLQVVQPINVLKGPVAPWFNQPGGGIQFILLDGPVLQLVTDGVLEIIE